MIAQQLHFCNTTIVTQYAIFTRMQSEITFVAEKQNVSLTPVDDTNLL